MIVTLTMNPAVDQTAWVDRLVPGEVHRVRETHVDPAGKGINASRMAHRLGWPTIAFGILAGDTGNIVERALAGEGVQHHFVRVPGQTRINTTVVAADGTATSFYAPGPAVSEEGATALDELVRFWLQAGRVLVLAGSLPARVPPDTYARYVEQAREHGVIAIVDADGEALRLALGARPDLIKPNVAEAERLLGRALPDEGAVVRAAKELAARAGIVVISMGARGAVCAREDCTWRVRPPDLVPRSTVGSGDSMVAGLAVALARGDDLERGLRLGTAAGAATAASAGTALGTATDVPSTPRRYGSSPSRDPARAQPVVAPCIIIIGHAPARIDSPCCRTCARSASTSAAWSAWSSRRAPPSTSTTLAWDGGIISIPPCIPPPAVPPWPWRASIIEAMRLTRDRRSSTRSAAAVVNVTAAPPSTSAVSTCTEGTIIGQSASDIIIPPPCIIPPPIGRSPLVGLGSARVATGSLPAPPHATANSAPQSIPESPSRFIEHLLAADARTVRAVVGTPDAVRNGMRTSVASARSHERAGPADGTELVRARYDRVAPIYDAAEAPMELLFFRRWRRLVWERAGQDAPRSLLELGIGTGMNLAHHPAGARVLGVDLSPAMLERARRRAARLASTTELRVMDAEHLDIPDRSFDAAVATFLFCSVADPVQGLREARRVLRDDGTLVLLEHVRPRTEWLGRVFDRLAPLTCAVVGCRVNRRTVENVRAAGFHVQEVRSLAPFDLVRLIVARRR